MAFWLLPILTCCAAWSMQFTKQQVDSKEVLMTDTHIGVMLMTYGSPATLEDMPIYLKHVYGGREASPEVISEFRRRYDLIGGSPLLRITREQAAAVEVELNRSSVDGTTYHVTAGMRFAP